MLRIRAQQLERDRRFLHEKEHQAAQALGQHQQRHAEHVAAADREKSELRRAVERLQQAERAAREEHRAEASRAAHELEVARARLRQSETSVRQLEEGQSEWKQRAQELQARLQEATTAPSLSSRTSPVKEKSTTPSEANQHEYVAFLKKQLGGRLMLVWSTHMFHVNNARVFPQTKCNAPKSSKIRTANSPKRTSAWATPITMLNCCASKN